MPRRNKYWIGAAAGIVVFFLSIQMASAQRQVDSQYNTWYMYFGTHKLTDKWGLHTQYQWRRNGVIADKLQSLTQVGVNYNIQKGFSARVGYGWMITYPYGKQPTGHNFDEHRIWQQLAFKQRFGRFYFGHRYRLEERYLQLWSANDEGVWSTSGWKHVNRMRFYWSMNLPLNHTEIQDKTIILSLSEEMYVGFGDEVKKNLFNQNRAYAGISYKHNAHLTFRLGYMNQWLMKGDGIRVENNHTGKFAIVYNLDLRKSKD